MYILSTFDFIKWNEIAAPSVDGPLAFEISAHGMYAYYILYYGICGVSGLKCFDVPVILNSPY